MDDRLAHRAPSAYIAALAACWCALPQLSRYDFHKKKEKNGSVFVLKRVYYLLFGTRKSKLAYVLKEVITAVT